MTIKERAEEVKQNYLKKREYSYEPRDIQYEIMDEANWRKTQYIQIATEQQKIDIEKACAEVDAILEEYGIKSYDRSRNLKRIKQAMEE